MPSTTGNLWGWQLPRQDRAHPPHPHACGENVGAQHAAPPQPRTYRQPGAVSISVGVRNLALPAPLYLPDEAGARFQT